MPLNEVTPQQAILLAIHQVPAGKVCTYGGIAHMAGLGRAARLVGNTLKKLPSGSTIPWHRIVNSQGKISFPPDHPNYLRQKEKLENEGIVFIHGKIRLADFLWQP